MLARAPLEGAPVTSTHTLSSTACSTATPAAREAEESSCILSSHWTSEMFYYYMNRGDVPGGRGWGGVRRCMRSLCHRQRLGCLQNRGNRAQKTGRNEGWPALRDTATVTLIGQLGHVANVATGKDVPSIPASWHRDLGGGAFSRRRQGHRSELQLSGALVQGEGLQVYPCHQD